MARRTFSSTIFRPAPGYGDQEYLQSLESWDSTDHAHHDRNVKLVQAASLRRGQKVLDLDCGPGALGRLAAELVDSDNVAYCDRFQEMLHRAKTNHERRWPGSESANRTIRADWCDPAGRHRLRTALARMRFRPDVVLFGNLLNRIAPMQRVEAVKTMLELTPSAVFLLFERSLSSWLAGERTIMGLRWVGPVRPPAGSSTLSLAWQMDVLGFKKYVNAAEEARVASEAEQIVVRAGVRLDSITAAYDNDTAESVRESLGGESAFDVDIARRQAVLEAKEDLTQPRGSITVLALGVIVVVGRRE